MRIVNRASIKLFLCVTTLLIALAFVLDPSISVTSSELQARPAAPLQADLTGAWTSESMGTYYVRQVGSTVWWMGQSRDGGVSFTNVFNGIRNGDQISGFWADVPAGRNTGSGSLTLSISRTGGNVEIHKVNETGGFGESVWKKRGAAPPPATEQPQPPPPPGFCTISGRVSGDRPTYATLIRVYRPDGSATPFSARVHGQRYSILNVPEGTYEVRGRGRYPTITGSRGVEGLGIFSVGTQRIQCQRNVTVTIDFRIGSIEG